jgi:HK97 family phage prohead protease
MPLLEVRSESNGALRLIGYASVVGVPYPMPGYTETISKGAFAQTLKADPDVALLLAHEGLPLARTSSGTLHLQEDDIGLRVEAELDPSDPDVESIARKLARGDLDGQMSFAFKAIDQQWNTDFTTRIIESVDIDRGDVSLVIHGANPHTSATIARKGAQLTYELRRQRARTLGMHMRGNCTATPGLAAEKMRAQQDHQAAATWDYARALKKRYDLGDPFVPPCGDLARKRHWAHTKLAEVRADQAKRESERTALLRVRDLEAERERLIALVS